jgi:predicted nucleotidyltransferase
MIANETDIRWIAERIVALCNPDRVYLFGSYAKGTAHEESDLDLLIVAPSALPRLHRGKVLSATLRAFPCHFDLLFFTPQELEEELKDPYSFISSITASGQLVYRKTEGQA